MVTIDEKLNVFSKLVYQDVVNESEEKIKRIEEKNKKLIEEHRKEFLRNAEIIIQNMDRRISQKKNEMISRANMDNKQKLLSKKRELLEILVNDEIHKAKEFVNTDGYEPFFKKNFEEVLNSLEDFNGITIELLPEDQKKFQGSIEKAAGEKGISADKITYKEGSKRMIGGVIVYNAENTIRYDASISSLLEDNKGFVFKRMYEELEKVGDLIDK